MQDQSQNKTLKISQSEPSKLTPFAATRPGPFTGSPRASSVSSRTIPPSPPPPMPPAFDAAISKKAPTSQKPLQSHKVLPVPHGTAVIDTAAAVAANKDSKVAKRAIGWLCCGLKG